MLRSRMLPDGFKLFFGVSIFAMFGAFILGVGSVLRTTDGASVKDNLDKNGLMETITGPISVGWKGGVGNHLGYIVLLGTFLLAGFVAFLLVAFRDADPEAEAQVLGLESVPLTRAPAGQNYSPLIATAAVLLMAFGWIKGVAFVYAGIALLVLAGAAWAIRAWAERATGDDEVNAQIYHRIIDPLRVPILGLLMIGYIVAGISRLFISADKPETSTIFFLVLGVVLFATLAVVGAAGSVPRWIVVVLLAVFAAAIFGMAAYGLVKGDRPAEPHETEAPASGEGHGGTEGGGSGGGGSPSTTEGGLAPVGVGPTSSIAVGAPA